METESPTKSNRADEAVLAACAACTRSGAFALLLSLAVFTMIPHWMHRSDEIALVEYVDYRLNLAGLLETLDGSVNWQTFKESNPEAESLTIDQLSKVSVRGKPVPSTPSIQLQTPVAPKKKAIEPSPQAPHVPPAPTGLQLSFTSGIDEIKSIADTLVRLNDSDLLTKSRDVSIFYNFSIYRWAIKRNNLLQHRVGLNSGGVLLEGEPDPHSPPNFVPSLDNDDILKKFTLSDVRELAAFELPALSDTTSLGVAGEKEIDVTPGALPRTLPAASLCAESLLLFVIIYFHAFAREVIASEYFPIRGTIFSAFAGSKFTRFVFGFVIFAPLMSSFGIFLVARRWSFLTLTILIFISSYQVFRSLQKRDYFEGVIPKIAWFRAAETKPPKSKSSTSSPAAVFSDRSSLATQEDAKPEH